MRWIVLLASLLVSACGGAGSSLEATAPVAESAPVSIHTAAAEGRDVPIVGRATGTFVADESSDVTPPVSGQVVATPVNVGDMVKAGDMIVRLDDRDAGSVGAPTVLLTMTAAWTEGLSLWRRGRRGV